MPGAISPNFHEGSRSEYLAQYVFTAWGTVVPVPHQEDHGLDLYCTLVERVGQRAWAKSPYSVQVKSGLDAWVFEGVESVRWLIEHPLPLFLCVVDKSCGRLRVYHTSPRFFVWSLGDLPEQVTLIPTTEETGHCTQWMGDFNLSLSAPILDVSLARLSDEEFVGGLRTVLEFWIGVDEWNLKLVRAGLRRFRMPHQYRPNDCTISGWVEQGRTSPEDEHIKDGVVHLAEALDCLGSQLFSRGDLHGAAKAGLLYRHLSKRFGPFFSDGRSDGGLTMLFHDLLNRVPGVRQGYLYAGIDEVERLVESTISPADPA